ncbi:MAG: hypothetical protein K2H41_00815 [Acetatifactor sp.]|nr:hypothetical protein [Acetatifactor sp.]
MSKQVTKKAKEIHRIYEECKKVFEPSISAFDEIPNIEEGVEREFYVAVLNFFTQQKQRETIKKGIF